MSLNSYVAIIILKVNVLNAVLKRYRFSQWIKIQNLSICCPEETHFKLKHTCKLEMRGWRKLYHANGH